MDSSKIQKYSCRRDYGCGCRDMSIWWETNENVLNLGVSNHPKLRFNFLFETSQNKSNFFLSENQTSSLKFWSWPFIMFKLKTFNFQIWILLWNGGKGFANKPTRLCPVWVHLVSCRQSKSIVLELCRVRLETLSVKLGFDYCFKHMKNMYI